MNEFESLFPPELQLDDESRTALINHPTTIHITVNRNSYPKAEMILATPKTIHQTLGEEIYDTDKDDDESYYIYSTAVLPDYQGLGLVKAMRAMLPPNTRIIGHATTPRMRNLVIRDGATILNTHHNWYGSGRTAHFYEKYT